ncbi:MAG: guanylate kinase [Endomicrobiaceae bacterium]|jgi:guanylate kinase|nr:guanylate kinase [Endomicrobiaceae bacterium]MDD4165981.1 guanylate kinase [Endomicrobiaceae bacterium]
MNKKYGMIIIVSAPSGAGKTSICDAIIRDDKNIVYSVSTTTRSPRSGEKNGREYFFVDEKTFKRDIKSGKFIEWAKVHDNYYGTSKKVLLGALSKGRDVLLDIDVQGALNIKKQYKNALMLFIMTPTLKELKNRLIKRNKDSVKTIQTRIENARKEIKYVHKYDYLIINDKLKESIINAKAVVKAERLSIKRNKIIF